MTDDHGSERIMRILREKWIVALSATMTAFVAMPSPAQTAPPVQTSDLEEVVVTARNSEPSVAVLDQPSLFGWNT
jgi:hypothetical protein